jgi:transposase
MSKRGNSLLRYSLVWTAGNAVLNNATFAAYYAKKTSEGKSHYQALGHCAKKLVNSIFHILKYNEAFNLA